MAEAAAPEVVVGVVSVPALGAVGLRRRALATVVGLVRTLLGDGEPQRLGRRLRELSTDPAESVEGVRFTARVLSGNLRLLPGMVRASRPWRPPALIGPRTPVRTRCASAAGAERTIAA